MNKHYAANVDFCSWCGWPLYYNTFTGKWAHAVGVRTVTPTDHPPERIISHGRDKLSTREIYT